MKKKFATKLLALGSSIALATGVLAGYNPHCAAASLGDADGNGTITAADVYEVLLHVAYTSAGYDSPNNLTLDVADIDGNGKIDSQDVFWVLLYVAYSGAAMPKTWDELLSGSVTPNGTLSDDGDVFTVMSWTDVDLQYMTDIVQQYSSDFKGKTITYKQVGSTGSEAMESYMMTFNSGEDVDVYFCDADWVQAYENEDAFSAPLSAVGITASMYDDAFDYTVEIGTDQDGVLKGAAYQSSAGFYVYRKDLAEEYLGVTSPDEMQAMIDNWDDFWATAATVYKVSGNTTAMADSLGGVYRAYGTGNRTSSWVTNGTLNTESASDLIAMAKTNYDAGYISTVSQWTNEWYAEGKSSGTMANKTFGYFMPWWGIFSENGILADVAGSYSAGIEQYSACQGPTSWYWGGTWMCVYPNSDNATLAGEFIRTMTCDEDAMYEYASETAQLVNNKSAMKKLLDSGTDFDTLLDGIDTIDMSICTQYDTAINKCLESAVTDYCKGTIASADACMEKFTDNVAMNIMDVCVE